MKKGNTKGFVLWLTGLPCSGKTTLSLEIKKRLRARGIRTKLLDGDSFRKKYSMDLGFSAKDRNLNIRRAAQMASRWANKRFVVLAAFVSPYRANRAFARKLISNFVEVYLDCPIAVCEKRDVKGHYKLARKHVLSHFTGVSDPYEKPLTPEIRLKTAQKSIAVCAEEVLAYLKSQEFFGGRPSAKSRASSTMRASGQ